MGKTSIEWATAVWNPVRGCTRVSPGCGGPNGQGGCYAEIMAARFSKPGMWGHGIAEIVRKPDGGIDHRWTGKIVEVAEKLLEPLHWKKPQRIFVNSTSDLFHPGVSDDFIAEIFSYMAICQQHTFLILTKRPDRMRKMLGPASNFKGYAPFATWLAVGKERGLKWNATMAGWPLQNVWLGISTEDQIRFDERWPDLEKTPAARRFISYEPALELVDFGAALFGDVRVDQIIIGGESGPGARDFHAEWAASALAQCHVRGAAAFMKQMGAKPFLGGQPLHLANKKGGDMTEWPSRFRVREMP